MPSGESPPAGEPSSEDDAPILGLERFAALSADIESGAARDEVIAREGLSVEAWTRAQESWLGKMADEASRKRFELTNRYNSAFVAQRRAEGSARRPGKKKTAASTIAAPAPPPIAAAPAFVAASPAFVAPPPPFVAGPPPFVAPPPVAAPAPFVAPPPVAAPAPFVAPPAPVAMPAIVAPTAVAINAAPPAVANPTNLGGTVAAEVISPFASGAPLPFKQGRAVIAEDPSPRPKPPPLPKRGGGKTLDGVLSPFAKEATPFAPSAEAKPAPATAPTAPLAPIKPLPRPGFDPDAKMDLGGTMMASGPDPADAGGSLPFRAASDAPARPPPPAPPAPGHGLPFRAAVTATKLPAPPPPAASAPPAAPAAAAPRATRFTLEQFASLTAEIAIAPASVGQVRGRYGLDEASHRAEAEEWGRRFSADKELFARYGALFQSYRDWLARTPR